MREYTEKERRESAEAISELMDYYLRNSVPSNAEVCDLIQAHKEHEDKFNPPSPDKELRERWDAFSDYIHIGKHNFNSSNVRYISFNKAIELNLLATQEHDNKVRVEVLDELEELWSNVDLNSVEIMNKLRTKWEK